MTLAEELAATFDHVPAEVHTQNGPTGRMCCGNCFVDWPCAVVRKIERVMIPIVDRHRRECAAAALRGAASSAPPVVQFDNGYRVRAVPVSDLLSFAAAYDNLAEGDGR